MGRGRWAVTWSGVTVHLPFLTALGEVRKPGTPREPASGCRDEGRSSGCWKLRCLTRSTRPWEQPASGLRGCLSRKEAQGGSQQGGARRPVSSSLQAPDKQPRDRGRGSPSLESGVRNCGPSRAGPPVSGFLVCKWTCDCAPRVLKVRWSRSTGTTCMSGTFWGGILLRRSLHSEFRGSGSRHPHVSVRGRRPLAGGRGWVPGPGDPASTLCSVTEAPEGRE